MKILSHRGFGENNNQKNSLFSFKNTIECGFGTETDIRDHNKNLVISHDVSNGKNIIIDDVFRMFSKENLFLALNIKSDGLQELLIEKIEKFNISNYFVFDMSIPDTLKYLNLGFNVYGRQSEYELDTPFYDKISGIWLDCFDSIWYDKNLIESHLKNNKNVCIVSSDLHGRNYLEHWDVLKSWNIHKMKNIFLCTDFPKKANSFFKI